MKTQGVHCIPESPGIFRGLTFFQARFALKQKILFLLFIAGLAAMVSAQDGSRRERAQAERSTSRSRASETVTISGTMVVANGMPALKSGDDTYLVGGVSRLIGFVDGLKEGAQVTVEGTVTAIPGRNSLKYLRGSKLTLGGKSYDLLSSSGMGLGMMGMWNYAPNGQFSLPNLPRAPMMNRTPQTPRAPQAPSTPQRFPRR